MSSYALSPDVHDIYVDGEQAAVYVGDAVLVLGPLASALVEWVQEGPRDIDSLAGLAVARFGAPGNVDPAELIAAQVADLCDAGILAICPI